MQPSLAELRESYRRLKDDRRRLRENLHSAEDSQPAAPQSSWQANDLRSQIQAQRDELPKQPRGKTATRTACVSDARTGLLQQELADLEAELLRARTEQTEVVAQHEFSSATLLCLRQQLVRLREEHGEHVRLIERAAAESAFLSSSVGEHTSEHSAEVSDLAEELAAMEEALHCTREVSLHLGSELAGKHAKWQSGDVEEHVCRMDDGIGCTILTRKPLCQALLQSGVAEREDVCVGSRNQALDPAWTTNANMSDQKLAELRAELDAVCLALKEVQGLPVLFGESRSEGQCAAYEDEALAHLQEEVDHLQRVIWEMASFRCPPPHLAGSGDVQASSMGSLEYSRSQGVTLQASDASVSSRGITASRSKARGPHELEPRFVEPLPGRWRIPREHAKSAGIAGRAGGALKPSAF